MRADVDFSNLVDVLQRFERQGRNLGPALPAVEQALIAAIDDVYEAEGPGWEPLAEATLRQRRKGGAGAKILQDTGVMVGSTESVIGSDYVEAFSGVEYAKYHASGTSRMPRRDPFDLGPFEQALLDDVADMLLKELTG